MERGQIKEVLRDVFGGRHPFKDLGDWISLTCPLAQWKHEKGSDTRPSFGISVNENDTSVVNCFTCGTKKPFHAFLREYADLSGRDLDAIINEVEKDEFLGPTTLEGWDAIKAANMAELDMPIDEGTYMDIYPSAENHPYLRSRGISNRTVQALELRYDPGDYSQDKEPRILFPVRGIDGLLYGFSGRATRKSAILKVKDYYGLKKGNNVLGAHLGISDSRDFVLVVEGLVDYANSWECGYPGCAVMHSSMTEAQSRIFQEIGKKIYSFYDDDAAGDKGQIAMTKMLYPYLPIMHTTYPEVWIEDNNDPEGGHWLGDPGEMEASEFKEMIDNAWLYIDNTPRQSYSGQRRQGNRR
ncbi:hypothetical protein JT27_18315 [Alcaligenes faecalis]|nr:hypothetical protein JT27_18315 [Alcaligenes faecalis]